MTSTRNTCARTCKQLCTPLEIALLKEKEAMLRYDALRDDCPYPEVKQVMNEILLHHQRTIRMLEEARLRLHERFAVLEQIQDEYDAPAKSA